MLPAYEYGRIACGPWAETISRKRPAMVSRASSQPMRSNRPSPLRPTRLSGCNRRSGL